MFRVLKAASAAVRRAALVINQQRSVTGQNTQRPSPAPKDIPPRVLISHGIDSPRMKYNVLERIVGELTGPKPILYLTHSLVDTEMAQELVADLIANKSTQTAQVDVQTIEDFMSSVLLSLLKSEEAKLLDSTDEALLLFKNFSSIVGEDSTFRPEEVHRLVDFFRKLEYFNVSPQQYAEYLTQRLEGGGMPDGAVRNIKMQQTLAVIYNRYVNLKNSKKVLNAYTFSLKLRSLPLSDATKSDLAKLHFNKYSHLIVNEPTLNVLKAFERLQVLSKPSAAQLTAILNVVDFDTRVLNRRDMSPHVNVIQTQLQYRAASLGIKQAASAMIQMLNINHNDNANTSFVDHEYRTPMGKKNGNVFYFNTTSNSEEIDSIGHLIQSLQNRYVNQFKLGYGDIRVIMSKDQITQVAQQLNVKHKVPVVIENVLNEPEIRATLLFLQLIVDISYLELFSNKPRKMSEVSENETKANEKETRSFNINRSLYELMTRYYGFDPEGEVKTIFLAASLYKSDFFRIYPKLANGQNPKFTISQETFHKCNELKLSLNHYVNMFRSRIVKPSELITEFIQKTIVPLKTATEQQKNNYRRLIEVVNRFESQLPSVDDDPVLNTVSGESKAANVLKEVVGQEQGPIEIANRKHMVMLLSFLSDLHVDQLPISYLTSGVRLSTFDTVATTPTHTTIIIGSRLKYLRTQLNVPTSFVFERPRNMSVKKQQIGQMFYNALRQTFHNLYVTNVPDVMEEGEVEHLQGILDSLKATELNSLGLQSHLAGITSLLPPDVTKPEKIDVPGTPSQWTTPFEVTMPHTLDRISFSSMVSYIHCPLQYCYRFVLKMRPTRYFDYQSAGQFLHEKIADYNEIRKDEKAKSAEEEVKKQETEVKATIEREKKFAEGVSEQQKVEQKEPEKPTEKKEKEAKEKEIKEPKEKEVKETETKEKEAKEKKEKEVKEKKTEKKETEKEVKEKEKPTEKKEEKPKETKEKEVKEKETKEKEVKEKETKEKTPKEAKEKREMTLDTGEVAQMANEAIKEQISRTKHPVKQPVAQPKQEVITKTAETFVNFQKRESEKGKVADQMEQAFVIKLSEKVELTGTWDRIDRTEQGVIVTEYKMSTRTKRQHTMLQLMIYGWAYEQVYGVRPLKVVLESIETGEKFDYVPNYDDNVKLQTLFFQFANTLATNTFQATPSEVKCSGCVYSNICPSSLSNV